VYGYAALIALNPDLERYAAMIQAQAREIDKRVPVPGELRPQGLGRRVISRGIGG
jgi:hypothetical protein